MMFSVIIDSDPGSLEPLSILLTLNYLNHPKVARPDIF